MTVARDTGPEIVIAQGVTPGDQVVTEGQARLATGTPVEIKTATAEAPPASPAASPATGR